MKTKNISSSGCAIIAISFILGAIIGIYVGSIVPFIVIFACTAIIVSFITIVSPNDDTDNIDTENGFSLTTTSESALIKSIHEFEENSGEIKKSIMAKESYETIGAQLKTLPSNKRQQCILQALLSALDEYNLMPEIPDGTEKYIDALTARMNISKETLASKNQYVEFTKSLIIQDILHGVTPHRVTLAQNPINFKKGEILIWPFIGVTLYEEVVKRQTIGSSKGINIRIAKGIYYRIGAFKGESLTTSSLQPKYSGSLLITNKNIYFYSDQKTIRFPYEKILSFVPFEDAIGIQPDRVNSKTLYINGLDGRFAFNIVSNIQNIAN